MNAEQIAADTSEHLLVVAPPGCGKTELLAKRAVFLIDRLRANQKILALTFSNKARSNLQERLMGELGVSRFRNFLTIRNFHGHAAEMLRAHARTIGEDPGFQMPGKRTLSRAIHPYVTGMSPDRQIARHKEISSALREAKQQPRSDAEVLAILAGLEDVVPYEIESKRQQDELLHYDDLLRHAQRLLAVDAVARLYQHHYGALLVDEFQDLSTQQLDIALRTVASNRVFAGDPLQGIYTWAGARPAEVGEDLRAFCCSPRQLYVSYRSSQSVLNALNPLATSMGNQALCAADPDSWFSNGASAALTFSSGQEEATAIHDYCKKLIDRDPAVTIGIVSRARWRRASIDAVFDNADLPGVKWDVALEDPNVANILRSVGRKIARDATLSDFSERVLAEVSAADSETYADLLEALEQFADLVGKSGSIRSALDQLATHDPRLVVAPGVHLLNAHTGKGQQFDWVFIPGLEDFHVPSGNAKTRVEQDEERRVLLVMLSRARHGVIMSRAETLISKRGRPYPTGISELWEIATRGCDLDRSSLEAHLANYLPRGRTCGQHN